MGKPMHGFQLHMRCVQHQREPPRPGRSDGNSYTLGGRDGVGGLCTSKSTHVTARPCTLLKHLGIIEGSSENFSCLLKFCKCLALWFICPIAVVVPEWIVPLLWHNYMLLTSQ